MKNELAQLPFDYMDTPERRVLTLAPAGFPCIPVLGMSRYNNIRPFLDAHRHPGCIEISLCVRAPLTFECEGKSYKLMPGHLFVTQPSDLHHLVTNPKGLFLYWMFVRIPHANEDFLGLPNDEAATLVRSLSRMPKRLFAALPEVKTLFVELFAVYDSPMAPTDKRLAYRVTLLRLLNRIVASSEQKTLLAADNRLYAIVQDIRRDPRQNIRVSDLAARAFMSESIFTSRFKRLTGYPPHAFVTQCRLAAVKERITSGDCPFFRIARDLGYRSEQHLANQFKATFGMTMRQWRSARLQRHPDTDVR